MKLSTERSVQIPKTQISVLESIILFIKTYVIECQTEMTIIGYAELTRENYPFHMKV
jgi:hypothetical protein